MMSDSQDPGLFKLTYMSNSCKMNSARDVPKLWSPKQDSQMPVTQGSPQVTQSSASLQDSTIISVLEDIIQIIYLYLLERTKMVFSVLRVSS